MKHLHRAVALVVLLALLVGCSANPSPEPPAQPATFPAATASHAVPSALPTDTPPPPTDTSPPPTVEPTSAPSPTPPPTEPAPAAEAPAQARITIVYDNTVYDQPNSPGGLAAEWGFAAWIEYGDQTILFDTGPSGPDLLNNLGKLGLYPRDIDIVVLSHIHGDHTGGLSALLGTGVQPVVYAPAAFPQSARSSIRARTELVDVLRPAEILPGLHTTGQLAGDPVEQALVVETSEGMVVITGCAHPGILRIVREAQKQVQGEVALVVGGFHLQGTSPEEVDRIVATLREIGVKQVSPTHCTGQEAIARFAAEYGHDYLEGGVGRVFAIGAEPQPVNDAGSSLPDYTVCASGCDFTTIQAALDSPETLEGSVIQVSAPLHTEAGILVGKSVTIRGLGVDQTVVQAHDSADDAPDRIFRIAPGATVTLAAMTIRHGHPRECPQSGGGILNEGVLTLQDCSLRDNVASAGGGLMNNGSLTILRCEIRDNVADGHGGENSMGRGSGGGIKNMVGPAVIVDSTISGNLCARNGGGIKVSCSGTLDLVNSTVSGNHAEFNGGGLEVRGIVTMTHSTIAGNEAGRNGGGMYFKGTSDHVRGILNFRNSIIAGNSPGDCFLGDNATIGANAHNLAGDDVCTPTHIGDPLLGPLASNGGATRTRALLPGSSAIDAIPAADCPLDTDQRGLPRPVAGSSPDAPSAGASCDIGAFETQPAGDGVEPRSAGGNLSPVQPTGGWPTSTPEEQGMDSALLALMLAQIHDQGHAIDGLQVVRNGHLVVDAVVSPFGPDTVHPIRSCTKSIVSALVGIAIEQGALDGVEQPVLELLPGRTIANLDAAKQAMTLEDLLTMAAGLECRDSYIYRWQGMQQMRQTDDWVQFMLDLPMAEMPGTRFEYCNGASFLLSAIIQEATGQSAGAFAEEHLFGPLGIRGVEWPANPQGISIGWGKLEMQPHDMAKIGYLYLNEGRWGEQQVVPPDWVRTSTRKHIPATLQDGYGYQWWVSDSGYYMALGYGGQFIFVVPEKNLVAVFVSELEEKDLYIPQQLLDGYIIPAARSTGPLPANPDGMAELEARSSALAQP